MTEELDVTAKGKGPELLSPREDELWRMLAPRSVAIVGASRRSDSLGGRILPILRQHCFSGELYLVNHSGEMIGGEPTYRSVADLPREVDVAVVVVAAEAVAGVLDQCGRRGIRQAIILSSGFAERLDDVGRARQADLEAARARHSLRVLGPNCEGLLNVPDRTPLTFSPTADLDRTLRRLPQAGRTAVVSQSGGLGFAVFNDGTERGLGFSYVVSTGNESDVDVLDVLELLVSDASTSVVLSFIEGVADLERLAIIAHRARGAGVMLVFAKVGRSAAGARAALAHTAHDVGDSADFERTVTAAGGILARDQEDLVDLALGFDRAPRWARGGVGILTISGGAGAWAADACTDHGLDVPLLEAGVQARLRALMPAYGSPANPVDVTAGALSIGGLVEPLEILCSLDEIGAVLIVGSFGGPKQLELEGEGLRRAAARSGKPVIISSYTRPGLDSIEQFSEAGLAWYPSSARAVRVLAALRR